MSNLFLRIISGLALGGIFLLSIFYMRSLFNIILYLITILMLIEWFEMTKSSIKNIILGLIFIPLAIASLLLLSHIDSSGYLLITYFTMIWSVDIMAMFGGKMIGGVKLAPRISPNKTVSGLLCGIFSAAINVYILSALFVYPNYNFTNIPKIELLLYILLFGILAQVSDLSVSIFKRKFGVKDTGTIIPGHGGVLDRFDSIILTAPVFVYFIIKNS